MNDLVNIAEVELEKIVAEAYSYYPNVPIKIALALGIVIDNLSDDEYTALTENKLVVAAIEDNYDYADDTGATSHIPIEVFTEIFT